MHKVWRWGSWIRWFAAASDSGTGESYSVNDAPQRKTIEDIESFKYTQGIVLSPPPISIRSRLDVGNAEMVEANLGRIPGGTPSLLHFNAAWISIFFKLGEKSMSA